MMAESGAARLITAPAEEPVALDEMKLHLRVDDTADDALISGLISAARMYIEDRCWIAIVDQTWALGMEAWADEPLRLPKTPLGKLPTITLVRYKDAAGAWVTVSASIYTVLPTGEFALNAGQSWPSVGWSQWPIEVQYTVGFGDAASVPAMLKALIKLVVGHWYENREAVVVGSSSAMAAPLPLAIDSLCAMFEVR